MLLDIALCNVVFCFIYGACVELCNIQLNAILLQYDINPVDANVLTVGKFYIKYTCIKKTKSNSALIIIILN